MRPESTELISFAIDINGEKHLKKLNIRLASVDEIINGLIQEHQLEGDIIEYGLRLTHSKNKKCQLVYITDENRANLIQDGCEIRLVEAPRIYLGSIFMKIYSKDQRSVGFEGLNKELHDNTLLKLITSLGWYKDICKKVVSDPNLTDLEATVSFNLIFKLLKRKHVTGIDKEVVETALKYLKSSRKPNCLYSTIVLLRELLIREVYTAYIISKVCIKKDLISILSLSDVPLLQCTVLSFINFMVVLSESETSTQIIQIMNLEHCRKIIFESVINVDRKITSQLEKELHLYQTHILCLMQQKSRKMVNLNDSHNTELNYLKEDMAAYMNQSKYSRTISIIEGETAAEYSKSFENIEDRFFQGEDMKECLSLLFDDESGTYSTGNNETVLSKWVLSSAVSTETLDEIEAKTTGLEDFASRISTDSSLMDYTGTISQLTLECLVYFKSTYPQSFYISLLEENNHPPGFYATCERLCIVLMKELRADRGVKDKAIYCPLLFESFGKPFFAEIFCRFIWLSLKTRIEMNARTADDQDKILMVLKAQIRLILGTQPKSYKHLMSAMKSFSYAVISLIWKKERRMKWKFILENNPNVRELSDKVEPEILGLIRNNRLQSLKSGAKFLRYERDKKSKAQRIYMTLASNNLQLLYREWNARFEICSFEFTAIDLSEIKYLVTGNACLHVKEHRVHKPELAFSLLLDDSAYDFEASSESEYNIWIDGLNNLIGKDMTTSAFKKERAILMETELMLRLLDVENIPLPRDPPPIPPPPANYDFSMQDECESSC